MRHPLKGQLCEVYATAAHPLCMHFSRAFHESLRAATPYPLREKVMGAGFGGPCLTLNDTKDEVTNLARYDDDHDDDCYC